MDLEKSSKAKESWYLSLATTSVKNEFEIWVIILIQPQETPGEISNVYWTKYLSVYGFLFHDIRYPTDRFLEWGMIFQWYRLFWHILSTTKILPAGDYLKTFWGSKNQLSDIFNHIKSHFRSLFFRNFYVFFRYIWNVSSEYLNYYQSL